MNRSGCKFFIDSRPWKELLCQSEHKAFDINEGELIRIFLTEENEEQILFIHSHHLAGDGQSVFILLNDIMNYLDGHTLTYKPMVCIDRSYLENKAKLDPMMKAYINNVNKEWEKRSRNFNWDNYYEIHKKYWDKHYSEVEFKTYDIKALKDRCPKGATVNSLLVAEILKDYPQCEVVGIPVSIRESGGMSNQTSSVYVKYKYDSDKTFETNVCDVHKEIHNAINDINTKYYVLLFMERLCPSLIDAILLQAHGCYDDEFCEKMARDMGYTDETNVDVGISNVKKIDIPSVHEKFIIKDIVGIPPKVTYVKDIIGISTYEDILTICYHKIKKY